MAQGNSHPQPGDLIEIDRELHQHWALYMGDGYVIHVIGTGLPGTPMQVPNMKLVMRWMKKQLLKEVVGNNKWRVNNRYDQYFTPLSVEEIIRRAESRVDCLVMYAGFGRNCERFVIALRYGEGVSDRSAFLGGEMRICDTTDDKCHPKPGDLIEIKRPLFQHWALYMGDGYVIHMTTVDEMAVPRAAGDLTVLLRKAKLEKELLTKVAGNDGWNVNNKHDGSRTPVPVEEIIRRAERWIDKEVPYNVLGNNCEHFVTELRYGDPASDQFKAFNCGGLPICDTTDDKCHPKPGDLIEFKRLLYRHWALYVGNGYVIHVTAIDEKATPLTASTVTILTRKAKVKKERLSKVAGKNNWTVNNKYDLCRTPLPVEEIIRRAERWIDREVPYRLFRKNCEHFVTELRYGDPASDQAWNAFHITYYVSSAVNVVGVASLLAVSSVPGLAALSVGLLAHCGLICSGLKHFFHSAKYSIVSVLQRRSQEVNCC